MPKLNSSTGCVQVSGLGARITTQWFDISAEGEI